MKRTIHLSALILLTALLVLSSACASPAATTSLQATTDATTAQTAAGLEMTAADLTLTINGTDFAMIGDAAGLTSLLGEPVAFSEAPSCLYEGTDKTFEYDDVIVYTITRGGVDQIDGIDLISGRFTTSRGITVGRTADDVRSAYGEPYAASDYDLTYLAELPGGEFTGSLTFVLENGIVSTISLYSGSNNSTP